MTIKEHTCISNNKNHFPNARLPLNSTHRGIGRDVDPVH